jgi:hypothetical protein
MALYLVILSIPLGRTIYGLEPLTPTTLVVDLIALVVWLGLVVLMWRQHTVEKFLGVDWEGAIRSAHEPKAAAESET